MKIGAADRLDHDYRAKAISELIIKMKLEVAKDALLEPIISRESKVFYYDLNFSRESRLESVKGY